MTLLRENNPDSKTLHVDNFIDHRRMAVLSCGAGMQSTALALMSCENVCNPGKYPLVPIYDAIIYCDLGCDPPWVYKQVRFLAKACKKVGIPFYVLTEKNLYEDFMTKFGKAHVSSIPFFSIGENGKKSIMHRHCTIDYSCDTFPVEKAGHEVLAS